MSRGLEYLEEDWQDETQGFERIKHRPKHRPEEVAGLSKRKEGGKKRKDFQQAHKMKHGD